MRRKIRVRDTYQFGESVNGTRKGDADARLACRCARSLAGPSQFAQQLAVFQDDEPSLREASCIVRPGGRRRVLVGKGKDVAQRVMECVETVSERNEA